MALLRQGPSESMKAIRIHSSFVIILCALLIGCSSQSRPQKKIKTAIPQELAALSSQFKQQSGANRISLAKQIRPLMPSCLRTDASSGFSVYDYSRPTFLLDRTQTVQLLGQPDELRNGDFSYNLGTDRSAKWYLAVEFHNGYVVVSRLDVDGRKKSRRR